MWCSLTGFLLWSIGAVYYLSYLPGPLARAFAIAYTAGAVWLWNCSESKQRWLRWAAVSVGVVYVLTLFQRPSHDRDWDADHARLPRIEISGSDVIIKNFRRCTYRSQTDYDAEYGELSFRIDELSRVWFGVQRFTTLEGLAHTFLSFEITGEEPRYFSVSVEIRREKGEVFSPLQGMYRNYELIYVVADERDIVGVRTVHRPTDRVYLYPLNASATDVQSLFRDIAARSGEIRERPEFYHSILNNCTNNLVTHATRLTPEPISSFDPRVLLPGLSDRLAHARGLIGREGRPFNVVRELSRIDKIARSEGVTDRFSRVIRTRLPSHAAPGQTSD